MRTLGFGVTFALLVISGVGVPAVLGEPVPSSHKGILGSGKTSPRVLERFDANHNGVLDPDEREALKESVLSRFQQLQNRSAKAYDANGNGVVEPAERKAMMEDRAARRARVHARALTIHDVNKNGVLDPAERQTMRERRTAFLNKIRVQELARFDKNRNGTLDAPERAELYEVAEASKAKALQTYDINHDGRVSESERPGSTASAARASASANAPLDNPTLSSLRVLPVGKSAAQGVSIEFALGRPTKVTVRVFDVAGRLVRMVASGETMRRGMNSIRWDTLGQNGSPVSNGIYWVRVEAFGTKAVHKLAIVR